MKSRLSRIRTFDAVSHLDTSRPLTFLCPALSRPVLPTPSRERVRCFSSFYRRFSDAPATTRPRENQTLPEEQSTIDVGRLPLSCPGCGALSQRVEEGHAGYYNVKRPAVRRFLEHGAEQAHGENAVFSTAVQNADRSILKQLGLDRARHNGKSALTGSHEGKTNSMQPLYWHQIPTIRLCATAATISFIIRSEHPSTTPPLMPSPPP
jgi:hypothetical protein